MDFLPAIINKLAKKTRAEWVVVSMWDTAKKKILYGCVNMLTTPVLQWAASPKTNSTRERERGWCECHVAAVFQHKLCVWYVNWVVSIRLWAPLDRKCCNKYCYSFFHSDFIWHEVIFYPSLEQNFSSIWVLLTCLAIRKKQLAFMCWFRASSKATIH